MISAETATARDQFRANVPRWYRGPLHLAFTYTTSLAVTAALAARVRALAPLELVAVPAFFIFCAFAEYLEHRYLLHQRTRLAAEAFRIHTLEHHRFYTEAELEPESRRDWAFVLFPPPLVIGYMVFLVAPFTALFHWLVSPNVGWLVGATAAFFFFLYEVIHFASHLGDRFPLRGPIIRFLARHHGIHHRTELMTTKNFNVVCPLFDWLFGTLALASLASRGEASPPPRAPSTDRKHPGS